MTNRIWFTDNGPSFGDEINFVEPGFNGGYRQIIGMSSLKKSFDENNLVSSTEKENTAIHNLNGLILSGQLR